MSRRLAEAASKALARRRPRRGFLAKTAVVGSALAVAPTDFLLKPASAYARVCNCAGSRCNCGKLCCDGYTEFCCTIYGTNGCPPGSLYGGWWRVSGSNYCGGSNRYYMDCHEPCNGCSCGANGICSGRCNGTKCGCALGSCNNRKAGCTHFRYGQCNQQLKCVGPIVCRVVTCTAPWKLEPNCTTSSRTDEQTRNHNRACLSDVSSPPVGSLDRVAGSAGTIRVLGWAIDPDTTKAIDVNVFVNGRLVTSVSADQPRADVGAAYSTFGEKHGFDLTFSSTTGTKEVCVYAVNKGGGPNPLLGCKRVKVKAPQPTGILETASLSGGGAELAVTGWAVVPGSDKPLEVRVSVDDADVDQLKANTKRKDLAPTLGDAGTKHGFEATIAVPPDPHRSGPAMVCATVTDPKTGKDISLGCIPAAQPAEPAFGKLEAVVGKRGRVQVTGWVIDPNLSPAQLATPGAPGPKVRITVDGTSVKDAKANDARPDKPNRPRLASQGGFSTHVSAAPGDRNICVYALGANGAVGALLGCATVSVKPAKLT